eukprot:5363000-Heterocapsa_arctica.AAC.1
MITGRQLLHLTYEQFALDLEKGSLYDIKDLMKLKNPGDAHLEAFLLTWNKTVDGLSKDPADGVLEAILLEQIEHSVKM